MATARKPGCGQGPRRLEEEPDRWRRRLVVAAMSVALAIAWAAPASLEAQAVGEEHDHDHDHQPPPTGTVTSEEQMRIDRLFSMIVCSCPDENWTLSLNGCPNACADRQKNMVRRAVKAGRSDEEILAEQKSSFGPKAVGRTSARGISGFLVYAGPFIFLLLLATGVVLVLRAIVRRTPSVPVPSIAATTVARTGSTELDLDDRRIGEAIDRELEEMD